MATIRDVAKAAGMSVATVSRALNGSALVTDATRIRIEAAAALLDYWPHGGARSLITSRTHALGVLLPDLYGQFFSEVIRGLDQGASERGFQILLSSSHANSETFLAAARAMSGRVDGLIVMAPDKNSIAEIERVARKFPVVVINPHHRVEGCSTVSAENFEGAVSATRHLLDRGHRRIAFLAGPVGNMDAEERLRGYRHALQEAEIRALPGYEIPGDFTESSGHRAAGRLHELDPRPTAVFAANDAMAVGLLGASRSSGFEIPRDLSLVGFDDIPIAQYLTPPLTTVRLDAHGLGKEAVDLLLETLGPGPAPVIRHETLRVRLVVRDSCGSDGVGAETPGNRRAGSRTGSTVRGKEA